MSNDITRREFVRKLGRYACMGVLGGLVFDLGLRSGSGASDVGSDTQVCGQCRSLPTCSLPEAVRVRRERAEKPDMSAARRDGLQPEGACPYRSA